ncbi:MAG: glyoxalase/bleomycin resistance/extradiol dioxygenase family protein [Sphingomonadales bacterium]|nr:MAG: glyoxalase/bleomycin resistance/extradiol dioxygenase family protein [Sphingomonadales bacterium]
MPTIETYRKQAKQLVRWHREGNYSIGGKVRLLARYSDLSDIDVLAMTMPLALAQEIVAVDAGFVDWSALKAGAGQPLPTPPPVATVELQPAVPILFVCDVTRAAAFYCDMLGFAVDFLHGAPPFYGSVSRGLCRLHLRQVGQPNFATLSDREVSLILAIIETAGVRALFAECEARGAEIAQPLTRQVWGGLDFHVRDPDGNIIAFVEYGR